jgi:hypothetical protein
LQQVVRALCQEAYLPSGLSIFALGQQRCDASFVFFQGGELAWATPDVDGSTGAPGLLNKKENRIILLTREFVEQP